MRTGVNKRQPTEEKSQSGTKAIERFQEMNQVKSISSNDQQERKTRLYSAISLGFVPSLTNPEKRNLGMDYWQVERRRARPEKVSLPGREYWGGGCQSRSATLNPLFEKTKVLRPMTNAIPPKIGHRSSHSSVNLLDQLRAKGTRDKKCPNFDSLTLTVEEAFIIMRGN
ncbi:unnamed protein product [Dovyalis caffra]|uniref:Uncharacterized protein n=1 Tax=Dovyalis caffra TaxID=77055 RepID=A0AAV1SHL4_9ROSI|nr:unnamed protein product [Dovyalis caffra]